MPPELGGAIAGGAAGYAAAPEDQKGAGAVLGGLGGAGVGRLARGGLPNSGMKHALRRELDVTKEVLSSTHADLSMTRNPQMAERMRRSIREGQAKVVALEEAIKTGVDARHLLTPREDLGDLAADARNIIDGRPTAQRGILKHDQAQYIRDREAGRITHNGFGGSSKPLDMSEAGRMQRAREEWGKGYQVFEGTHATSADFDAFDPTKIGQSDPGWYGRGHYFARADKGFKEQYSRPNSKGFAYGQVDQASSPLDRSLKEGSRNIPVLIRMKKPFTDDAAANPKVAQAFWDAGYRSIERDARNGKPRRVLPPGSDERRPLLAQDAETFSNVAKSLGYDGANWGGEIVVFPGNEANIRGKFAKFDPSQSGSSKLLAGMGASPEGLGAAAGGVIGWNTEYDADGDGDFDNQDRAANATGGLISGGLGVKGARMGVGAAKSGANALRNAGRGAKAEAPRGSFGGRSNAASTISENQAIRNQLVDLRSERPRATPERQAEIDEEVAALNGMLGDETPASPKPTQAGFLPSGSGKPGAKPPANALAGPISPRVLAAAEHHQGIVAGDAVRQRVAAMGEAQVDLGARLGHADDDAQHRQHAAQPVGGQRKREDDVVEIDDAMHRVRRDAEEVADGAGAAAGLGAGAAAAGAVVAVLDACTATRAMRSSASLALLEAAFCTRSLTMRARRL